MEKLKSLFITFFIRIPFVFSISWVIFAYIRDDGSLSSIVPIIGVYYIIMSILGYITIKTDFKNKE
ncbi:hypothetical protein JNUCC74_01060 [Cerasibacillus sp. JNUCC 74]